MLLRLYRPNPSMSTAAIVQCAVISVMVSVLGAASVRISIRVGTIGAMLRDLTTCGG
jgi:uridine phosphorylase